VATSCRERTGAQHPLNVFLDRYAIRAFAQRLDLRVIDIRNGDEPFVPLPEPLILSDGTRLENFGNLGQSICVLQR
jgi:hypothetical protein